MWRVRSARGGVDVVYSWDQVLGVSDLTREPTEREGATHEFLRISLPVEWSPLAMRYENRHRHDGRQYDC